MLVLILNIKAKGSWRSDRKIYVFLIITAAETPLRVLKRLSTVKTTRRVPDSLRLGRLRLHTPTHTHTNTHTLVLEWSVAVLSGGEMQIRSDRRLHQESGVQALAFCQRKTFVRTHLQAVDWGSVAAARLLRGLEG